MVKTNFHSRIHVTTNFIYISLLVSLSLFIVSCSKKNDTITGGTSSIDSTTIVSGTAEGSVETGYDADDLVEGSTFTSTVAINFGATVGITNPLATAGVVITQSGSDVTINSTATAVEFTLSGAAADGSVKIYSDKKFKLTLNGVTLTNADGPALNIQSSKRAFIVVADNTGNSLTDGANYATSTEDQKGTIFSEGQIIFSGNGSLTVKGNYKHAIASDGYIRIRSGNITVSGAKTDGIHSNDAFIEDGGTLTVTSGSDGIEAEKGYIIVNDGSVNLNTVDDGMTASYEDKDTSIHPYITINGGTISVTSASGKGIESKSMLTINKGNIAITTSDDGIHAATSVYINGGSIYSSSSANDAMDSNGTFTITGGKIVAIGGPSPESGIDCGARTLKITGGIVVGIGGATSSPATSVSTIRSVILGSGVANQIIHLEASDGVEALTFQAPSAYSTFLFASAKLKATSAYSIYNGGTVSNGSNFHGLYTSGIYTKGTISSTFTTTDQVTQLGGTISKN